MISLDTNIIQSALNPKDVNHQRALSALNTYANQAFCICPVVRAELRASSDWKLIEAWLEAQGVSTIWATPASVWDGAGIAFAQYAKLRRNKILPRRIVADFLIAAHAAYHQLDVLTFDDTVFSSVFPNLTLL